MNSYIKKQACILCMLNALIAPWSVNVALARNSDAEFNERIAMLERIINAQAKLLQQLQQQLSDNQRDIDKLRGEVQQNSYQLNQLVEQQKRLLQQWDSVRNPVENGQKGVAALPTDKKHTINNEKTQASSPVNLVQSDDANREYNDAVMLILEKKQYDRAIQALQTWIKKYPDSTFQPNANYWLGQLNYNKGNKDNAAHYFAVVVKKFPQSPKSAEALFKVGVIMQDKNDLAKAKAIYRQVMEQHPATDIAAQAKRRFEILSAKG